MLLPGFPDNPKLCVYSAVCAYIGRTQTVRETLKTTKLFISYGRPIGLDVLPPSPLG